MINKDVNELLVRFVPNPRHTTSGNNLSRDATLRVPRPITVYNNRAKKIGSANEVNRIVVALLSGVTYDEIVSSCIVAQKELGKLIDQQPGKRGEFINVFLNLNDFNDTR